MEGFATMLRDMYGDKLDSRALRWLALIEENGRELTQRVQSIFELAQVGTALSAVQAVDPAVVLQDVIKQLAGSLEAKHIRVHIQRNFPLVACHCAYLRQVFENLLSNAIKFLDHQDDPEIRVTAEREGDQMRFSVSDNGAGIPRSQHERVFQPFVRLDPQRTKGSGIGLTIVRRIVDLYGGQTYIDSEPGAGCTVTFSLPLLGELGTVETHSPVPHGRAVRQREAATVSKAKTILPTFMTVHHQLTDKAADAELKEQTKRGEAENNGHSNG